MAKTIEKKKTPKVVKAQKKTLTLVAPKAEKATPIKTEKKQDTAVKTIEQLQKEVVVKRMELRMGKLKDVRSISKTHDEIARLKTAARMKELTAV